MARADKGMGAGHLGKSGPKGAGSAANGAMGQAELAAHEMGRNSLQGNDQDNVRNERKAYPEAKLEADATVTDGFRKMDKDERAREDLNKGQGVHPGADR